MHRTARTTDQNHPCGPAQMGIALAAFLFAGCLSVAKAQVPDPVAEGDDEADTVLEGVLPAAPART